MKNMEATRNYLDTIRKALENWQEWSENGDTILDEKGWLFLHGQLNIESRKLRELDVQEVEDEVLRDQDGIRLRLRRLVNYGISKIRDDVLKIAGKDAQLTDAAINDQLTEYRSLIVVKTAKLAQAYNECAAYLKPQTSKPAARWWKDGELEKAQEIFRGQRGAAVARAILRMVYEPPLPLPTYKDFNEKFPDVIKKSYFSTIRKEFEPPKKIEKNAIK